VASVPLVVGFNSMYFEVVKVEEGEFFKRSKTKSTFSSEVDPKGQIVINAASINGSGGTIGPIAVITFKAIAEASDTAVQVVSATPANLGGHPMKVGNAGSLSLQVHDSANN